MHPLKMRATTSRPHAATWHLFVPKLFTVLRQGYSSTDLRHDIVAGITVAIVALPLAMALAIASGTTPEKGLLTAAIAGFFISAFGGSRFQIGGPTGAFVVVVFDVIQQQGYDGLIAATFLAGIILAAAGWLRLGTWIKYIPEPVVTGFTSGIAVIIFSSQIKDFFGLDVPHLPAEFIGKLDALWDARNSLNFITAALAVGSVVLILTLKKLMPKIPGFLLTVVAGSIIVAAGGLTVDTIGTRFAGMTAAIPTPTLPVLNWDRLVQLLPSGFTIAFLAGVESLLSAVVADGMTGRKHRSNCELVAQGIANIASALFGGMPATGAIARTATNIRSGARSPISGMIHAVAVLIFMLALWPLAQFIPLACLAAILIIVAWNMAEIKRFRELLTGPMGDRLVLVITFALTVLVDLTVAIEVGVILAAILFMHRMSNLVAVSTGTSLISKDIDDFTRSPADTYLQRNQLPQGVEVFQVQGPLFFGAAGRMADIMQNIGTPPQVLILRLREVPMIDATGARTIKELIERFRHAGSHIVLSGLQPQPKSVLDRMGIATERDGVTLASDYATALTLAENMITQRHNA